MTLDQELSLTVTAAECNILLQTLAEAPFRVSAPLIDKLRRQIEAIDSTAFAKPNGELDARHL